MSSLGQRIGGFWYDIDRSLNVLFGGRADETISGTLGRSMQKRPRPVWGPPLVLALNAIVFLVTRGRVRDHCQQAAAVEEKRGLLLGPSLSQ